ncbi:MAG: hypothetical protein K0S39_4827 [Paenibacillus sp.]|jgi:hypothetical protein|nr:hypothetical protein [Paenibacillus sp.]
MPEKHNPCEEVFSYFLKELSPEMAEAFEIHLATCQVCMDELKELQQVWQTLPYEMDEVEVPEPVKALMLDNILLEIDDSKRTIEPTATVAAEPELLEESETIAPERPRRRWTFAAAVIVCIMIGAAAGWGLNEYGRDKSASGDKTAPPAQVIGQYALKAFDPAMPSASGQCWIKQQGQEKQLVVQVNGLGQNSGDQAYQVWIVKQGTRFNGGTFRVDAKGSGVLTHNLSPLESPFETIGITLEPDALGTKPRGKKVLGS